MRHATHWSLWSAALLIVTTRGLAAQGGPWISLYHGRPYELVLDAKGEKGSVYIPVRLQPDLKAACVGLTLRLIHHEMRLENELRGAFTVHKRLDLGQLRTPAIKLTVDTGVVKGAGTYYLTIEATRAGAQPPSLYLELPIKRPAARVWSPGPVIFTQSLWWWQCRNSRVATLELREYGGKSGLTGLIHSPLPFVDAHGQTTSATIELQGLADQKVAPDGTAKIKYQLKGPQFPLGVSKATWEINAPQLEQSLRIQWEVRTRSTPVILGLAIFLGMALGFYTRVLLKVGKQLLLSKGGNQSFVEIQKAEFRPARFWIAALIAFLGGLLLFEPTWLGTRLDYVRALVWAFGVNVTVDSLR
jgi:hypothetical protein